MPSTAALERYQFHGHNGGSTFAHPFLVAARLLCALAPVPVGWSCFVARGRAPTRGGALRQWPVRGPCYPGKSSVSTMSVYGPEFTSETSIMAPNTPDSTWAPSERSWTMNSS